MSISIESRNLRAWRAGMEYLSAVSMKAARTGLDERPVSYEAMTSRRRSARSPLDSFGPAPSRGASAISSPSLRKP